MAIARTRPGNYPAVLSYGFRPFFLLGSLYAGLAILLWLPLFYGHVGTASAFAPVDWHVHEMLFGFVAAIMTGFLLTAIPNWTGRLPVQGLPLSVLVGIWLAGRIAVFFSAEIGWVAAAVIDCAFLAAVALAAATEIVAGRNWRNLKVLAPVLALLAANALFHAEAHYAGVSDISRRLGIGAVIVLVTLIGGRIIPSFTRNWLARENPGRLPAPFGPFDAAVIGLTAASMAAWACFPMQPITAAVLVAAGILNVGRQLRWAGDRTARDSLVLILHVAYAFVPTGLVLAGLAILLPDHVPPAAAVHAFGVGAFGCMTLAVMTRATLGHTGHELRAGLGTYQIYTSVIAAAVLRIAAAFAPGDAILLHTSACLWALAFLGYTAFFGSMLVRPTVRARRPNVSPA